MTDAEETCPADPALSAWEVRLRDEIGHDFLLLGAGNDMKGDDAAGPAIARGLQERGIDRAIDAGPCPENYLGRVREVDPRHLIVADACDIGEEPGTVALRGDDDFAGRGPSTHAAGVRPLSAYMSRTCTTRRWVLAVQPVRIELGADMSRPVERAVERIVSSRVWRSFESPEAD
jgi:hydrogenase 3 maturation protease